MRIEVEKAMNINWSAAYQETYLGGSSGIGKMHSHSNMHQIIYVTDGECEFKIDEKTYIATAGSFVVISNIEDHRVKVSKLPYKRYILYISVPFLQHLQMDKELLAVFSCRSANFKSCVDVSKLDNQLKAYFDRLVNESNRDDHSEQAAMSVLTLILVDLYRHYRQLFVVPQDKIHSSMYKIKQYMDVNYGTDISLDSLANTFHISKSTLCRSFKELTGNSPKKYLALCRLAAAKSLLYNTDMQVSEVAATVGFGDVNNFIRFFKEQTKITPLQFRKTEQ